MFNIGNILNHLPTYMKCAVDSETFVMLHLIFRNNHNVIKILIMGYQVHKDVGFDMKLVDFPHIFSKN